MSSSKSSEGSRGNTNEDDNEDKNELEYDNEDSTEEQGGEPYMYAHKLCARCREGRRAERRVEGAAPYPRVFTPTPKRTTAQISKARKVSTEHANTRTMGLVTAPTYAIAQVPIAGATSSIPADK